MRIAMISGSLRAGSANSAVLREAASHLQRAHPAARAELCRIDDIPPFNEDVEAICWPTTVRVLREQIDASDVVIISTPEYNGSVPGVLKNAVDWLSRPDKAGPLFAKPVATLSASPTNFGAIWAQENLRFVLEQCQSVIVNDDPVVLPLIFEALGDGGELLPGQAAEKIHRLVDLVACSGDITRTRPWRSA